MNRGDAERVGFVCTLAIGLVVPIAFLCLDSTVAETWRCLEVAPENRCSPYDKRGDYPHPQSIERKVVRRLGGVYGPYTGTCFDSPRKTDIEHIVATSEAHDSGLCARDRATRTRFARDLRNLTLGVPRVNRHEKSGVDAAEWLPDRNRCWFAARVVEVRLEYDLTIDRLGGRGPRGDSQSMRECRHGTVGMFDGTSWQKRREPRERCGSACTLRRQR